MRIKISFRNLPAAVVTYQNGMSPWSHPKVYGDTVNKVRTFRYDPCKPLIKLIFKSYPFNISLK